MGVNTLYRWCLVQNVVNNLTTDWNVITAVERCSVVWNIMMIMVRHVLVMILDAEMSKLNFV